MNETHRAGQPADLTAGQSGQPPRTRKWLWIGAVVVSACVVMMLAAVVILLATPSGAIKIEVDDPNIEVAIDGKIIRIEDAAIPLAVGAHNLALKLGNQSLTIGKTVRVGDEQKKLAVTLGAAELRGDTFTIVRGQNPVMSIRLLPAGAPLKDIELKALER
jgi:hypothetical protein